jgi:hypothetical protein
MSSYSSFKVSGLTLRSLIHFKSIFVQVERKGSRFSVCVDIQFPQYHGKWFLIRALTLTEMAGVLLVEKKITASFFKGR